MATISKCMKGSRYRCLLATDLDPKEVRQLLIELCEPLGVNISKKDEFYPKGFKDAQELILTSQRAKPFFNNHFPEIGFDEIKTKVKDGWWLTPKVGGNTPNWDLVCSCRHNGAPALILVEAKAHTRELCESGKIQKSGSTTDSKANHTSISRAISIANEGLNRSYVPEGFNLSVDRCYQLSNRFAFAWKLASIGVPVILVYLGFINTTEMGDDHFHNESEWSKCLIKHSKDLIPQNVWNSSPIMIGNTPIYTLHRAVDIQATPKLVKIYPPMTMRD